MSAPPCFHFRNFLPHFRVLGAAVNSVLRSVLAASLCLAGLNVGKVACGQEDDAQDSELLLLQPAQRRPAAAAELIGMGTQPIAALLMRERGQSWLVWGDDEFVRTFAPPLDPQLLRDVRDGRRPPKVAGRLKEEVPADEWAFFRAYSDALVNSLEVPVDAFKKSAEENRHVSFANLMSTPSRYRGKVIRVKGRLAMLRWDEPADAARERGVKDTYVGWVFGETRHATPYCIYFPALPPGLEPREKMDREITFYGYFLATIKYEGAPDGDKARVLVTPLLIGPAPIVTEKAVAGSEPDTPLALLVLGGAMGLLLFVTVVFFVMNFWLQRGDRKVLATLDEIKRKNLPSQFENEDELGTRSNPAPSQLIMNNPPGARLPEAKPIDPERN